MCQMSMLTVKYHIFYLWLIPNPKKKKKKKKKRKKEKESLWCFDRQYKIYSPFFFY